MHSPSPAVIYPTPTLLEEPCAFGGGPAPEIRRAVHNFRLALSLRLGKGPLAPEEVRKLTAIIDAAAAEVERG